jgi:CheY-like chemotaxis protein
MKNSLSLLIIDDDSDDVELFKEAFSEVAPFGKCISKKDGKDGLEFLMAEKNELPDLIFLDLNMPRINGMQCLREIHRNQNLSSIPVIIYTTSRQHEDEEETKKLGAVDFITKPSNYDEIKKVIKSCIKKYTDFSRRPLE